MKGSNTPYLARLDHLRAFAAFTVLVFHIGINTLGVSTSSLFFKIPIFAQGHCGVALFMVISGFILAHIVGDAEIHVWRFYLNRILRIYPLFVFIVALGYFATPDPRPVQKGINFLMALSPISNLYRLNYGMYGGTLWSVAVELQFYLLFPLLYFQLRSRKWKGCAALISSLVGIRLLVYMTTGAVHTLAFFTLFGGLDAFVFGFIADAAYRKLRGRVLPTWVPVLVFVATLALIQIAYSSGTFFHFDYVNRTANGMSKSPMWIVWPTIQAAAFCALTVSYMASAPIGGCAMISDFVAWLGKISYSLYIWHTAVLLALLPRLHLAAGLWLYTDVLIIAAACVAVSAASYYVIERPFLAYRVRYIRTSPAI